MERQGPDLIKAVMARFHLTQPDLAKVLHITQQAVSNYARGIVKKEQASVIDKLREIRDGKIDKTLERILEEKGMGHLIQRAREVSEKK
jgi:predicted transcriptional regulator